MTTARHRAIDWLRRRKLQQRKQAPNWVTSGTKLISTPTSIQSLTMTSVIISYGLIFTTCHPMLPTEARVCIDTPVAGAA